MFDALAQALAPPVLERLTLVLNHVLRSEPVALARLVPHAGREIVVELAGCPALLPPAPPMRWRVTPAGMLEWCAGGAGAHGIAATGWAPPSGAPGASEKGSSAPSFSAQGSSAPAAAGPGNADLRVVVDAANPAALLARALAGQRPAVQVEGDAAFAADIGWLLQNLRWDVAADLERFFGPVVAGQLHQLGRAFAGGLRAALDTFAGLAAKAWAGPRATQGARAGTAAGKSATEVVSSVISTMAGQVAEKAAQFTSRFGPGRR
jgi:ubiquinone biosynthesis protein UbiJ